MVGDAVYSGTNALFEEVRRACIQHSKQTLRMTKSLQTTFHLKTIYAAKTTAVAFV